MDSLEELLLGSSRFLRAVELVSTRGTMADLDAVRIRRYGAELASCDAIDWVSITDSAGGNPQMSGAALGRPILYAGKEVLIHLSCKDANRNGLESLAWLLASEGFRNVLALSGDYPAEGYAGRARPVFDIDSVGLLTLLGQMKGGDFFLGAVTTNFKRHENEVIPQYLKLEQKIAAGARFVIGQIGFDARKQHEQLLYLRGRGLGHVPLVGSVFLLSARTARFLHAGHIPGVTVSDALLASCTEQARSPDAGAAFFLELAAKQAAVLRGLGYRGVYYSGVHRFPDLERLLELDASFAPDDWKGFAREIRFRQPGEFYRLAEDPATGLADPDRLDSGGERSPSRRRTSRHVTLGYRLSRWSHDRLFSPGRGLAPLAESVYRRARDPRQGPTLIRTLERVSKAVLYDCRDCGDCSLPEIAFLCPESQCVKNQRNGPCGGTRDGRCEVGELPCIWARAYDRAASRGGEQGLLDHAPVLQDQGLRGTSAWANTFLGRDHLSRRRHARVAPDREKKSDEDRLKGAS